jgi:hypothetical protein
VICSLYFFNGSKYAFESAAATTQREEKLEPSSKTTERKQQQEPFRGRPSEASPHARSLAHNLLASKVIILIPASPNENNNPDSSSTARRNVP